MNKKKIALRNIILSDISEILSSFSEYAVMQDNTKYFIIHNETSFRGVKIDQLIIVDDYRWNVYKKKKDLIRFAKVCLACSCVPDEFLVLEYEV